MTSPGGFRHIRPGPEANLLNHENRIRAMENSDWSGDWVYVDDGSGNPLFNAISPPFLNSWTNVGPPFHLVSFKRFANWIHIRGAFTGGADGTIVFTLPLGWLPGATEVLALSTGDGSGLSTVSIDVFGNVTYITQLI